MSDTFCSRAEGRGFSPVVELGLFLGALAPEAMRLQDLKVRYAEISSFVADKLS